MDKRRVQVLFESHQSAADPTVAEDLTQEVFLRALRNQNATPPPASERPWLFRIARNLLIDRWRRTERRALPIAVSDTASIAVAAGQGLRTDLHRALSELPSDLGALSALVDGERVRPAEVATALDVPGMRGFLIDCARLRWEVGDVEQPRPTWVQDTRQRLAGRASVWLAAVALAATLLFGVLWIARPMTKPTSETLPEPDRVIRFEPGLDWSG